MLKSSENIDGGAYESVGRGFESLSAYQLSTQNRKVLGAFLLFYELFLILSLGFSDRVTDLLRTAKDLSLIAWTASTRSSA